MREPSADALRQRAAAAPPPRVAMVWAAVAAMLLLGMSSEGAAQPGTTSGTGSGTVTAAGTASGSAAPAATPSIAELMEQLSGGPDVGLDAPVSAIEAIASFSTLPPDADMLPDAMFVAARASEEQLRDPPRALALYERILERFPDARVAVAAGRRARHLREQLGVLGASASEARAFSQLMADGDRLPLAEALSRADELSLRTWPGAAEVLLWSAELVRRRGDLGEAIRRYRAVIDRFSATPSTSGLSEPVVNTGTGGPAVNAVTLAIRGLAGAALEHGDWALAEQMALALPAVDPADAITRDELLTKAESGRRHQRWAWAARIALAGCVLGLLLSLLQLCRWQPRPALGALVRPPVEVAYMGPAAALLIGASFSGNTSITPAVVIICLGGLGLAWLSGATLAEARRRQLPARARILGHLIGCAAAVLALAYLAIVRTGLLDLLISTVQLGPER